MGTLDDNGIYIYDETDIVSPLHTYMNLGQASNSQAVSDLKAHTLIMPVGSNAERDAYVADMTATGMPPSPEKPLWIENTSSGTVERNRGAGWEFVVDPRVQIVERSGPQGRWKARNTTLVKKNGWVVLNFRMQWSGAGWVRQTMDLTAGLSIPSNFRPVATVTGNGTVYYREDYWRTFYLYVYTDGQVKAHMLTVGDGQWLNANLMWPTND